MKEFYTEKARNAIAELTRELRILKEQTVGWFQVDYKHGYKDRHHAIDIEMWVTENCGEFKKYGTTFYFREEKDASMFALKWL